MTTMREWIHSIKEQPRLPGAKIYEHVRKEMIDNPSKYEDKWWDTVITELEWKIILTEALE